MRNRWVTALLLGMMVLGALSAPVAAQERMAIVSRDAFVVQQCVPAMRQVQGERFAQAICECAYRNLRDQDEVTFAQFEAANRLCMMEHEYDPDAFLAKYLTRAD